MILCRGNPLLANSRDNNIIINVLVRVSWTLASIILPQQPRIIYPGLMWILTADLIALLAGLCVVKYHCPNSFTLEQICNKAICYIFCFVWTVHFIFIFHHNSNSTKLSFWSHPIETKWYLQNFAYAMTAKLSGNVQNFVVIWWPANRYQQNKVSIEIELLWENW